MADPLISVVIPVYNGERYLAEAIESVLEQDRGEHEVIAVLDGCTDGSEAIALSFGEQVEVISQPRAGMTAARNRGIAAATGGLLGFIDHDDIWKPGMARARLERFDADPELDLIRTGSVNFVSPDVDPERAARLRYGKGTLRGEVPGATLIRREAWDRVGGMDESLEAGDFLDWILRARRAGLREELIEEPLLLRRIHVANTTLRVGTEGLRDYARVLKRNLDLKRGGPQ